MSFTFLKQQSDSMNEELVTNKLAPFDFKQLRRYTVLYHYNIIYSFIYRERERVFLMCVYTCVVCEISSLALFLRHVLLGNILAGQVLVVVP